VISAPEQKAPEKRKKTEHREKFENLMCELIAVPEFVATEIIVPILEDGNSDKVREGKKEIFDAKINEIRDMVLSARLADNLGSKVKKLQEQINFGLNELKRGVHERIFSEQIDNNSFWRREIGSSKSLREQLIALSSYYQRERISTYTPIGNYQFRLHPDTVFYDDDNHDSLGHHNSQKRFITVYNIPGTDTSIRVQKARFEPTAIERTADRIHQTALESKPKWDSITDEALKILIHEVTHMLFDSIDNVLLDCDNFQDNECAAFARLKNELIAYSIAGTPLSAVSLSQVSDEAELDSATTNRDNVFNTVLLINHSYELFELLGYEDKELLLPLLLAGDYDDLKQKIIKARNRVLLRDPSLAQKFIASIEESDNYRASERLSIFTQSNKVNTRYNSPVASKIIRLIKEKPNTLGSELVQAIKKRDVSTYNNTILRQHLFFRSICHPVATPDNLLETYLISQYYGIPESVLHILDKEAHDRESAFHLDRHALSYQDKAKLYGQLAISRPLLEALCNPNPYKTFSLAELLDEPDFVSTIAQSADKLESQAITEISSHIAINDLQNKYKAKIQWFWELVRSNSITKDTYFNDMRYTQIS